jgi:hypothetical protein
MTHTTWRNVQTSDGNNIQFNMMSFVQLNPVRGLTIRSQAGIDGYDYRESRKQLPSYVGSLNNGSAYEYFSRDVPMHNYQYC